MEREEWEEEAGREREKRERLEEERRGMERRLMDAEERRSGAEDGWRREEKRASNLEEVLSEFQAGRSARIRVICGTGTGHDADRCDHRLAKDLEIAQATNELESQLRYAATSLAEYKSRTADAEVSLRSRSNRCHFWLTNNGKPCYRTGCQVFNLTLVGLPSSTKS
jgi:hypothetical protein